MKVIINSKETETAATTIAELAAEMSLPEKGVAIAVDNNMVPRTTWADTALVEGSKILVIKAFCGG